MWSRKMLKDNAKLLLKPNYWKVVVASIIVMFCSGASGSASGRAANESGVVSELSNAAAGLDMETMLRMFAVLMSIIAVVMLISILIKIFALNPLIVGAEKLFINGKYGTAEYNDLWFGFKNSYGNTVKTLFLRDLFVSLWSLLLVIPGIVKAYEYRMIPYLIAENPQMDTKEAFRISKQMMMGNKWNAFVLDLSFLGWVLLELITCGIAGIFYINPYIFLTNAELYHVLKTNK